MDDLVPATGYQVIPGTVVGTAPRYDEVRKRFTSLFPMCGGAGPDLRVTPIALFLDAVAGKGSRGDEAGEKACLHTPNYRGSELRTKGPQNRGSELRTKGPQNS